MTTDPAEKLAAMLEERTKPKAIEHEPGIYFGMPAEEYHADPALGSSNLRDLLKSPSEYWYGSHLNPARDDESTRATVRGTATHLYVLNGEAAFLARYYRGPDQPEYFTPAQKGVATKKAKDAMPAGMEYLAAEEYDRCVMATAMIVRNPHLMGAFQDGAPEVAVFWDHVTGDGEVVRCKMLADYLKPRGVGDLKTVSNWKGIVFKSACREAMAEYRYDVQAAHYLDGRRHVAKFISDGRVNGATDPDFLNRLRIAREYAFQFVFLQAQGTPLTWSTIITPAWNADGSSLNPFMAEALADRNEAIRVYLENMAHFGPDEPWLEFEKPAECDVADMPSWYRRRG